MHAVNLARFICLDFEASALGPRSYPIEAGLADPVSGDVRSWLIRPHPRWLLDGEWNAESAAVHGITRETLASEGHDPRAVYSDVLLTIAGREVLSDDPTLDGRWFRALAVAAEGAPPPALREFDQVVWALCVAEGRRPDIAWAKAKLEARLRFPYLHRAGADARSNAEMLRLIAGVASE